MNIVVLVDFENDSVRTALEVARALGPRLWGVRLDTSGQLVDRSLWGEMGDFDPRGVNERLVRKVRDALDADGFERVRIVASGGFTVDKIEDFERKGVPVDAYGIGSSLIRGQNDFTADIVMTDGRPSAKVGRRYRPEPAARARQLRTPPERLAHDARPLGHRRLGADEVRTRLGEALEGFVGLVGEVDRSRHDDRRGAVLEQVDLRLRGSARSRSGRRAGPGSSRRRSGSSPVRRSRRRRTGAAARRAAWLRFPSGSPSRSNSTSGPEHRVVLGERVVALRLEVERRPAGDRVEEERLLDRRDERVADPAEHGVERPDGEAVLAALLQRSRVVAQVLLGVVGVEPEALGGGRADPPAAGLHVRGGHGRERLGMTALARRRA